MTACSRYDVAPIAVIGRETGLPPSLRRSPTDVDRARTACDYVTELEAEGVEIIENNSALYPQREVLISVEATAIVSEDWSCIDTFVDA